jgi:geranylgeranyl pyrophosphate synthase
MERASSTRRLTCCAGTVVTDSTGRVLLELRLPGDSVSPSLWTTPAGDCVDVQRAAPTQTGRFRFFTADEIPEETSLDTLLAVLSSLSRESRRLRVSDVTDRIFSAMFYSRLWSLLTATWPSTNAGSRLLWTIRNIPFRKFKSAVPFLLAASNSRSIVPALAAELMFALFYLVDDVIDERTQRYGRKTALGAGGSAQTVTAIMLGLSEIDEWLVSMQASHAVRRAARDGAQALADEQNFRRGAGARTLEDYADHSKRRTRFLGDLWAVACQESGCETEASLIRHIYGACALAGQIKNDLSDIRTAATEERFRDIRDGVRNACVLRLFHVADDPDREWLTARLAARSVTADDAPEFVRLFSKYRVDAWAASEVRVLSQQILRSVDASGVTDAKKIVLSEWVTMQFTAGLDADADCSPTRVARLIDAVAELTDLP